MQSPLKDKLYIILSKFRNCALSSWIGAHRLLKTNIARLPRNGRDEWIGAVEANRNDPPRVARDVEHLSTIDETTARRRWAMNRPPQQWPARSPAPKTVGRWLA